MAAIRCASVPYATGRIILTEHQLQWRPFPPYSWYLPASFKPLTIDLRDIVRCELGKRHYSAIVPSVDIETAVDSYHFHIAGWLGATSAEDWIQAVRRLSPA